MPNAVPSRLARRQGKKTVRRSLWMIFLAVGGSLLFLFVLMPQLIQLFFRIIGTGELSLESSDTVPPQIPVVSPLPEATKESSITVEGFGEPESDVVFVVNGQEMGKTAVDGSGAFTYTLDLTEGENSVNVYGVDAAGNESNSRQLMVAYDTQAPTLAFEDLEDGKQVMLRQNQTLEIRGETEPKSQLTLNERSIFVGSDGTFRTTYHLNEGENALLFTVTDLAGNRTERKVTVSFRL